MGIKFKIARKIFIKIAMFNNSKVVTVPMSILERKNADNKKIIAKNKLDKGPAKATMDSPHFLFFRLFGL